MGLKVVGLKLVVVGIDEVGLNDDVECICVVSNVMLLMVIINLYCFKVVIVLYIVVVEEGVCIEFELIVVVCEMVG